MLKTSKFGIIAAFKAMSCGTKTRIFFAFVLKNNKIENSSALERTLPSSPNSPKTKKSLSKRIFCSIINKAIAKSKCEPFFFTSLGLRFTLTRIAGSLACSQDFCKLLRAAFTRVVLSFIVVPASPTISIAGKAGLCKLSPRQADFNDFICLCFV